MGSRVSILFFWKRIRDLPDSGLECQRAITKGVQSFEDDYQEEFYDYEDDYDDEDEVYDAADDYWHDHH